MCVCVCVCGVCVCGVCVCGVCVCVCVGIPTRFGLREAIQKKWKELSEIQCHGDYHSTYNTSFRSLTHLIGARGLLIIHYFTIQTSSN